MYELVSIIIPVYNVDNYVSSCIKSTISQTYENIEVLLIDDGSTDSSGNICDEFSIFDSRVRVIHKPNGGVSSARNYGLREAKGKYIGFVDGDDYIAPDMFSKLVELIEFKNADISICGHLKEMKNKEWKSYWNSEVVCDFSSKEMLSNLLTNHFFTCSVCTMLFRKDIIGNIRFDTTKKHNEDLLFLYEVMKRSSKAAFTSEPYYYYRTNEGSASQSAFSDATMDIVYISEYILGDIQKNMPELYSLERREFMRNNITCASAAAKAGYSNTYNIERIRKNIKRNLLPYLFSSAASGYKFNALLISVSWNLFKKYGR